MSKGSASIKMIAPDRSKILVVDGLNANDLMKSGWVKVEDFCCDACDGIGIFDGEECWHCLGERIDPTKT